jgi:hypothetical protein
VLGDARYQSVFGILASIQNGSPRLPPSIAIGTPKGHCIVLVEGHSRVTAFAAGKLERFEVIYGSAPLTRLMNWSWFPPDK